jgi:uncharacterized paraquat-inducible protein A
MKSLSLICLIAVLLAAQVYKSTEQKLPREVAPQPIAFSHKAHAAATCTTCHTTALKGERAGLPQAERCALCHRGGSGGIPDVPQLKEWLSDKKRIPWVRVYKVPEYVFFSHARHTSAKIGCESCHGAVAASSVLAQEVSTSMTACMNCHAERKVSNECGFCHTLGY